MSPVAARPAAVPAEGDCPQGGDHSPYLDLERNVMVCAKCGQAL